MVQTLYGRQVDELAEELINPRPTTKPFASLSKRVQVCDQLRYCSLALHREI